MEPPDVCYDYDVTPTKKPEDDYELEALLSMDDDEDYFDGCASGGDYLMEYHGHEYGDYDWKSADSEANKKFEKMWPTVDAICDSLIRRPREWKIGTHTIKHKPSGEVFWTGSGSYGTITQTYKGSDAKTVFSSEQGEKIRAALNARHIHNPTDEQLHAMKAFGVAPVPYKPEPGFFGRLWAAIKFFPILVKFCVGYRA